MTKGRDEAKTKYKSDEQHKVSMLQCKGKEISRFSESWKEKRQKIIIEERKASGVCI